MGGLRVVARPIVDGAVVVGVVRGRVVLHPASEGWTATARRRRCYGGV
jgi:hypothetical protein